jgi:hypothetical protein
MSIHFRFTKMQHPTLQSTTEPQALGRLLDANQSLPPEYADQLTNHLPMALHALHSLGATPSRMEEFQGAYRQRFDGVGQMPVDDAVADWRPLRAKEGAYPALLATFTAMLARNGAEQVLRDALPDLMPGVAAAAFHALIRTAHALEAGHSGELAAALAYWAWRWQPIAPPVDVAQTLDFDHWAECLVSEAQGWRTDGPLISIRMEEATQSKVYQSLGIGPRFDGDLPAFVALLSKWVAQRYVATPNFTVLHMITGLRAFRTLMPWMGGCQDVQPVLMQAVTTAYLAAKVTLLPTPPNVSELSWRDVTAKAIASDDDHVIKLVHACVEEAKVYGEGVYLQAARLVVR